jgi:ribosomal protein L16 Arg81 hydroxylase
MFGLTHLLAPVTVDDYVARYRSEKALLIQGTPDKFPDLFGWDDVNAQLNLSRRDYAGMRLVHETNGLPHQEFANLDSWLSRGATLVINNVNQIDPVLSRFSAALSLELNTHVNINCYVSCPSKQGFDNHFDRHDVFIVQTCGTKRWRVFEPTKKYPLHRQYENRGNPPTSSPYIDYAMNPGDVLYIPRGHWHYAIAVTPSIHLTVGPESRSASEFLSWLVEQLTDNDEFFRQDFPIVGSRMLGGDRDDAGLEERIEGFRARLQERLSGEALKEAFIRYCMTSNPLKREFRLPETWTLAETISPSTSFRLPVAQKAMIRYDEDAQIAIIHVRGQMLQLRGLPREVLARFFDGRSEVICGSDLLAIAPHLEWEKLKKGLLQMFTHGLIVLADEAVAPREQAHGQIA